MDNHNPHIKLLSTGIPFDISNEKKSIAVLMSGGVDSSVTALLLKEQGWNVVGITMKIPVVDGSCNGTSACCGAGASLICASLGIPHFIAETEAVFKEKIVERFRQSYLRGGTPSPCVDCNTILKFGLIWNLIERELGVKHLATGHYAEVRLSEKKESVLARAKDISKDQSYFLYGIPKERLPFLHFPLSDITKEETRKIAEKAMLHCAKRPESMEICFAPNGDYRDVFGENVSKNGFIINKSGKILGEHKGIHFFTLGQRRGLGISSDDGEPLYVIGIDAETAEVTVGKKDDLFIKVVFAYDINVLMPEKLNNSCKLFGKVRSTSLPEPCEVAFNNTMLCAVFEHAMLTPAPDQRLVLYDENGLVVAGGHITTKTGLSLLPK